jgi:uncharacterized membrane protein YraQ (UPF0718 family)
VTPKEPPADIREKKRLAAFLNRVDWGLLIVASLSFGSAAYVLKTEGLSVAKDIFVEDSRLLLSILPKVILGCLIAALIRLLLARETIERFVGTESGLKGIALASLIGMLFPAGPFTIFPLAVVLLSSGADRGAAIAFISGWLLVGLNRAIIWEMPFLGPDFVLFRFMISLPMPVLLGLIARLSVFDRFWPPDEVGPDRNQP